MKKIKKILTGNFEVNRKQILYGTVPLVLLLNVQLGLAIIGIIRVNNLVAYFALLIFIILVAYSNITLMQEIIEENKK